MTIVHKADGVAEQPGVSQQEDIGQHMVDTPTEAAQNEHLAVRIVRYGMEQRQFQVGFVLVARVANGLRGQPIGIHTRRQ